MDANPRESAVRAALARRKTQPAGFNWGLFAVAILAAMFMAACALALIALETGFGSMVLGMICAILPVPIYIALLLWLDRYEPEPAWMLATAFCWGGLVAFISSMIMNTINGVIIAVIAHNEAVGEGGAAVISAPLVEESSKAAILFIFYFWRKKDFDGIVDGVVYAGMVALGFAMTENILYYGKGTNQGVLVATIFVRGILSPYAHPLFTSMTGIGLGWARESKNTAVKILAPLGGLMLAMFLHCVWNASDVVAGGVGFLLTYALFMVPAFFTVLGVVVFALRREGRMVNDNLKPEMACGVLSAGDLTHLSSVRRRFGASFSALSSGGYSAWRARSMFHDAASSLAFHRKRMERGQIHRDAEALAIEEELVCQVKLCKEKLHP